MQASPLAEDGTPCKDGVRPATTDGKLGNKRAAPPKTAGAQAARHGGGQRRHRARDGGSIRGTAVPPQRVPMLASPTRSPRCSPRRSRFL